MIWLLTNGGRVVFEGSYQAALAEAERQRAVYHVVTVATEEGRKAIEIPGRGFYEDGTERPPQLDRAWMLFPRSSHGVPRRAAA